MKVRAIDKTIQDILTSDYYKIPRFQRPYSWDNENITEFWNDTIANRTRDEEDYFIGAIVVYDDKYGFKGGVDGQQRMTTIVILLSALREAFKSEGFNNLSQGIQNIIERKNINNENQFVLSTESSYPFFQEKILKFSEAELDMPIGPEEKNIENAYQYFLSQISNTIKSLQENRQSPS